MKKLIYFFLFVFATSIVALTNTPAGSFIEMKIYMNASNAVSVVSNIDNSVVVDSNFGGAFITVATDALNVPLSTFIKFTNTIKNFGNHDEIYKLCLLSTNNSGSISKWNAHFEDLSGSIITTLGPISRFGTAQFVLAVSISNGSYPDTIGFKIGAQTKIGNDTTSTAYVGDNNVDYGGDIGKYWSPGFVVYNTNGGTPSQNDGYITLSVGDTTPPTIPTLVSPVSNTLTNTTTLAFVWNASTDNVGVDHYVIEVDNTSSAFGNIEKTSNVSGLSATFTVTEGTKYWRVRAVDVNGNESANSIIWTVTIDTTGPSAPALVSPTNGSSTIDNTPMFTWNASSDSSGVASYDIVIDEVTNNVAGTSFTPGSALSDGSHNWQVRAIDSLGNAGSFSSIWSVTIDTTGPSTPVLTSPTNGASTIDNTPMFTWNTSSDSNGVASYDIVIDGVTNNVTSTSFTPGSGLSDGTHNWQVRAIDSLGNAGSFSSIWSVTIDTTGPSAPVLSSPANGSSTIDNTPTFTWNASSDSSGVASYDIVIDGVTNNVAGTSFTPGSALSDGLYNWQVRAIDSLGNVGSFSGAWSVTIDATGPNTVTLNWPGSNSTVADTTITFQWDATSDATSSVSNYDIQIDDDSGFGSVNYSKTTNGTSYIVSGLTDGIIYYWRVRARDSLGNVNNWSSVWTVQIDTNSIVPILYSPTNNAISSNITPTFVWSKGNDISSNQIVVDNITNTFSTNTNYISSGLSEGTHTWKVRVYKTSTGVWQPFSSVYTYIVDTTSPSIVNLISLTNGSIITNSSVLLTWNSSSDAHGIASYSIVVDGGTNNVGNSTNYNATTLSEGNHSWSVEAIDVAGNRSGLSASYSFTVDLNAPLSPTLVSPTNGIVTGDNTPTFVWNSVNDLTGIYYRIAIGTNTNIISSTNFTSSVLSDGNYTWSVDAIDGAGHHSGFSASRSFTVLSSAPAVPSLVSPVSNFHTANTNLSLIWNSVAGAVSYNLKIDSWITNVSGTNCVVSLLEGNHLWQVETINAVGTGSGYSVAWNIVVDLSGPNITLLSPVNGATLYTNFVTLKWNIGTDATAISNYRLQVSTNNFSSLIIDKILTVTNFTTNLWNAQYNWRIVGRDTLGNVQTNSIFSFIMKPYQANISGLINVSDGIHSVTLSNPSSDKSGKIAKNSTISISFNLSGDANSSSEIRVIYNINHNADNGNEIIAKWTGEKWIAEFQGDNIDAQVGDTFYFKIITDGHIIENIGDTNGWGFTVGEIIDQENGVTIVNNAIRKGSGDKVYIKYPVTEKTVVSICVYNISGELVKEIVNEEQESGIQIAEWDGTNIKNQPVGRGIYLIVIKVNTKEIRKVIVR